MLNHFQPSEAHFFPYRVPAKVSYIHPDGDFRVEFRGVTWAAKLWGSHCKSVQLIVGQEVTIVGIEDNLILLVKIQ
jgi:membrane protein implicated in regulation of membrane protease activity